MDSSITGFHAHVYYRGTAEHAAARVLREQLAEQFDVTLGRWRDEPVGPHSAPMYQVAFAADQFADIVPFLMLNRGGLAIFVHPETGRPRDDHLLHALWLGEILAIDGSVLPEVGDD